MKRQRWHIGLGLSLIIVSFTIYLAQIVIFRDGRSTFFYMLQDFAFVPIQVLLVTLVVNEMLAVREKSALLKKMNMVIGAFFSEVGTALLKRLSNFDIERDKICPTVRFTNTWSQRDFSDARRFFLERGYSIDVARGDLDDLKSLLTKERMFLLGLLENGNLLEHESFTELLWAVFHLAEELDLRDDLQSTPPADRVHIAGDIKRAYSLLLAEWLLYVKHLKDEYPYLFSVVVRTNPFDPHASPVVSE
jgi:hypothetical protein